MSTGDATVDRAMQQLRLILFSMIGGLMILTGIAFALVSSGFEIRPEAISWLYPALGGVLLLSIVAGIVARRMMAARLAGAPRGRDQSARLAAVFPTYRTLTLVSAALAEAPALFGVVAFLLSGSVVGLLVTALGILRLVMMLPSEAALAAMAD